MYPTARMDVLENRKSLCTAGNQTPIHPARSLVIYQIGYSGSSTQHKIIDKTGNE